LRSLDLSKETLLFSGKGFDGVFQIGNSINILLKRYESCSEFLDAEIEILDICLILLDNRLLLTFSLLNVELKALNLRIQNGDLVQGICRVSKASITVSDLSNK
jgi:hypothetical protein